MKNFLWIQKAACDKQRVVKPIPIQPTTAANRLLRQLVKPPTNPAPQFGSSRFIWVDRVDFCGVLFPLARPGYIELYNFIHLSHIYIYYIYLRNTSKYSISMYTISTPISTTSVNTYNSTPTSCNWCHWCPKVARTSVMNIHNCLQKSGAHAHSVDFSAQVHWLSNSI